MKVLIDLTKRWYAFQWRLIRRLLPSWDSVRRIFFNVAAITAIGGMLFGLAVFALRGALLGVATDAMAGNPIALVLVIFLGTLFAGSSALAAAGSVVTPVGLGGHAGQAGTGIALLILAYWFAPVIALFALLGALPYLYLAALGTKYLWAPVRITAALGGAIVAAFTVTSGLTGGVNFFFLFLGASFGVPSLRLLVSAIVRRHEYLPELDLRVPPANVEEGVTVAP